MKTERLIGIASVLQNQEKATVVYLQRKNCRPFWWGVFLL